MAITTRLRRLLRGVWIWLIAAFYLLFWAQEYGSWLLGLVGVGVLISVGWTLHKRVITDKALETAWPWPTDLRAAAEALARPIDPTPKRILPPNDKASLVAEVATTEEDLSRLIAEKPAAWPWAVFTSVLLQRRQAVQTRLRTFVAGYQPRPGIAPLSVQDYLQTVGHALRTIIDVADQIEPFMLSPAFTGAFGKHGSVDEDSADADADAIVQVANRLMDYHEDLLLQAEKCVQTPVESDAHVFVHDTSAAVLIPLVGYDELISTLCARLGEAQDLLPYTNGADIRLDDVVIIPKVPEELSDRLTAHIKRLKR